MTKRFSALMAVLSAIAISLSLALPAKEAAATTCQAQIDRELQRINVPMADLESIKVIKRSFGGKSTNLAHAAWIRLKSCETGFLMVNMTSYCMVRDSFTIGNCRIDGLPNY